MNWRPSLLKWGKSLRYFYRPIGTRVVSEALLSWNTLSSRLSPRPLRNSTATNSRAGQFVSRRQRSSRDARQTSLVRRQTRVIRDRSDRSRREVAAMPAPTNEGTKLAQFMHTRYSRTLNPQDKCTEASPCSMPTFAASVATAEGIPLSEHNEFLETLKFLAFSL